MITKNYTLREVIELCLKNDVNFWECEDGTIQIMRDKQQNIWTYKMTYEEAIRFVELKAYW
jgi:hypothetical protein